MNTSEYIATSIHSVDHLRSAIKEACAVLAAADEMWSFVLKYSWIPIPIALQNAHRAQEHLSQALGEMDASCISIRRESKCADSIESVRKAVEQLVDGLPTGVFNYTTREMLVCQFTSTLVGALCEARPDSRTTDDHRG